MSAVRRPSWRLTGRVREANPAGESLLDHDRDRLYAGASPAGRHPSSAGQVRALVELNPGYDLRLFVVGRDGGRAARCPLPLHTTPIDERNMVRIWHRLNSPSAQVDWFTGGPLDLLHATDFVLPPSAARRKGSDGARPGLPLLSARLCHPASLSQRRRAACVVPTALLLDSHHTKRDLIEQWRVPADSITVVQGAVDHDHFRPVAGAARTGRAHAMRSATVPSSLR